LHRGRGGPILREALRGCADKEKAMTGRKERGIHELYADDPERADWLVFGRIAEADRRGFLRGAGLATMGAALGAAIPFSRHMPAGVIPAALAATADEFVLQGKQGLIVMNDRPINIETPPHLLDPDITPTEHFFVRNNGLVPEATDDPDSWTLTIDGEVDMSSRSRSPSSRTSSTTSRCRR
jgi:hypothetical protein